jgi:hypothetical protein
MPAYTVAQLEAILGDYVAPGGAFIPSLAQVLPRLHDIGLWRDLAYEVSLSGANGYVTLPADTDAVLACTINDVPVRTRSLWHDVRISGRQATLNAYYGVVDLGFFPVMLDMATVQGVARADVVGPTELHAYLSGTTTPATATGGGDTVTIAYSTGTAQATSVTSDTGSRTFTCAGGAKVITSIIYNDVTEAFDLVDPDFPTLVIATVPTGSGVLRFRRFRTAVKAASTMVHLLVKRGCPVELAADTIIHLGNLGAIKHGLLGLVQEDGGEIERAGFHWGMAGKLLDQELASMFGSAKPTLRIEDPAASAIRNFY